MPIISKKGSDLIILDLNCVLNLKIIVDSYEKVERMPWDKIFSHISNHL